MFFFYITSVLLLLQRDIWQRILHPLKAVGRMVLTNYAKIQNCGQEIKVIQKKDWCKCFVSPSLFEVQEYPLSRTWITT